MTKEHTYQESNDDYSWYGDDDPCFDCNRDCDGWDAQFCCSHCTWIYEGDPPCDRCDPMDL